MYVLVLNLVVVEVVVVGEGVKVDDGLCVFDIWDCLNFLVYEVADIGVIGECELGE